MKVCSHCRKNKPDSEFYLRKSGKRAGKIYDKCKDCMKERGRKYYHNNITKQLPLAVKRTTKARLLKSNYLREVKNKPCSDCGVKYPYYVMDFDHRLKDAKIAHVAHTITKNWSLKRIKEEIEKCDLVCANCHRIRTHNRFAELAKVVTAGA